MMFIKKYALLSCSKTYSQVGQYKMFLMGFDLIIAPPNIQEYVFPNSHILGLQWIMILVCYGVRVVLFI